MSTARERLNARWDRKQEALVEMMQEEAIELSMYINWPTGHCHPQRDKYSNTMARERLRRLIRSREHVDEMQLLLNLIRNEYHKQQQPKNRKDTSQ